MKIVYAMTKNLYNYFMPTLTSLLEHNDPEKVYILAEHESLPYALPDCCEVVNVSRQTYFPPQGPNMRSQFTYMAMMRACYTELFPDEDKLIQLDIDTIICDSLQPLWDIDMDGKWIAACQEYLSQWRPYGPKYYNIGVSVHNLKQMRKDNVMPRIVNELNRCKMMCVEQDAYNKLGADKFIDIDVRYNESFCCGYTKNPAVVHFAGYPNWMNGNVPRVEYLKRYL